MDSTSFTDLLIHIFRGSDDKGLYRVDATISDGSFFDGRLSLDLTALLQKQLDAEGYGRALCEALFIGSIGQAHERAAALAQARTEGRLRVRLWIDTEETELHTLPWERLYHYRGKTMTPFSLVADTPFSRYVGLGISEPQPTPTDEVRILFAISNPSNLERYSLLPIDVKEQVKALRDALSDLPQVQVTIMPGYAAKLADIKKSLDRRFRVASPGPTALGSIRNLLAESPATHVLHFLGHGQLNPDTGETCLFLEDEDGTANIRKGAEVVAEIKKLCPKPALVFLAACDSSKGDQQHPFAGLGPSLVADAEIPAVIAMQSQVAMDLATKLTGSFYNHLLQHGIVDRALNEARSEVYEPSQTGGGWDIPVLFMRLPKGELFVPDLGREALEAMSRHPKFSLFSSGEYLDLPIEAIRLTANQQDYDPGWSGPEATAAVYLVKTAREILSRATPRPRLVVIIGGPGTNKSTQLKYIAWRTIKQSLRQAQGQATCILPIYVDLRQFEPVTSGHPIETLILESLRQFSPNLKATRLADLPDKLTLRVLFDHSQDLTEQARESAWGYVAELIASEEYRRHQYVLSSDPGSFDSNTFSEKGIEVHRLLIQPLSQRKIRHFLERELVPHGDNRNGKEILHSLNQSQLYDLMSTPALLVKVVEWAKYGECPRSRVDIMDHWVGDAIGNIPAGQGMRLHAPYVLSALAWQMQSARAMTWPVNLAFQTMAEIRGNREYSREDFVEELVRVGVMARVGASSLRFANPPLQAYWCALAIRDMANRDRVLRDISSTFDRHVQLRWWEETFVFLTGLLARNTEALRRLLDCIVTGVNLLEQEHVFLATRCLLECDQCRGKRRASHRDPEKPPEFICNARDQVCQALLWRSDSANEPDMMARIRAIRALGQLADSRMALDLGRIAHNQVRKNQRGESDYDYSSVRLAAAIALQGLEQTEARRRLGEIDTSLVEMYDEWLEHDKEAIDNTLVALDRDASVRSLAALALGDLLSELEEVDDFEDRMSATSTSKKYLLDLEKTFLDKETPESVRWAVTHALAMLNMPVVTKRLLEQVQESGANGELPAWRVELYKCTAYLIGRTRTQHSEAHKFLVGPCLQNSKDAPLRATAIEAIGWLANRSDKRLLEKFAANKFNDRQPNEHLDEQLESDLLRRSAIQALRSIGDLETVQMLQKTRREEWDQNLRWSSETIRAFYKTCQEIFWRLDQESRGARPDE